MSKYHQQIRDATGVTEVAVLAAIEEMMGARDRSVLDELRPKEFAALASFFMAAHQLNEFWASNPLSLRSGQRRGEGIAE